MLDSDLNGTYMTSMVLISDIGLTAAAVGNNGRDYCYSRASRRCAGMNFEPNKISSVARTQVLKVRALQCAE